MNKVISTDKAPGAIGPYSQAIVANDTLYTSGQIPIIPETGELVDGDIKAQAEQVCKNLGCDPERGSRKLRQCHQDHLLPGRYERFRSFQRSLRKIFRVKTGAVLCGS